MPPIRRSYWFRHRDWDGCGSSRGKPGRWKLATGSSRRVPRGRWVRLRSASATRVGPPADTSVAPGTSFTREWRITGRTNASRTYEVVAGFAGGGIESASLVGPGVIAIPEVGSAVVVVSYRSRTDAAAGTVS